MLLSLLPFGLIWELPKVLSTTEDAHLKGMSTFEADEHLQALMPSHYKGWASALRPIRTGRDGFEHPPPDAGLLPPAPAKRLDPFERPQAAPA